MRCIWAVGNAKVMAVCSCKPPMKFPHKPLGIFSVILLTKLIIVCPDSYRRVLVKFDLSPSSLSVTFCYLGILLPPIRSPGEEWSFEPAAALREDGRPRAPWPSRDLVPPGFSELFGRRSACFFSISISAREVKRGTAVRGGVNMCWDNNLQSLGQNRGRIAWGT